MVVIRLDLVVFLLGTLFCLPSQLDAQLVAKINRSGKCGYAIDGSDDYVIKASYDQCGEVKHGTMIVTKNNQDALIDTSGNVLIDFEYKKLVHKGHNVLASSGNQYQKLYDLKGVLVYNEDLDWISKWGEQQTLFLISKDGKYGLLSGMGEVIQPMTYDSIFHTNNYDYYFFKRNDKIGIMNLDGAIIHAATLYKVNKISNDSIMVMNTGEWMIWSSADSTYTSGKLKEPYPDVKPCFDCTKCKKKGRYNNDIINCAMPEMLMFLYRNLKYPSKAIQLHIEGTAVIQFTINTDGRTSDFEHKTAVGYGLEEAAIEVIRKMKFEIPAMFEGEFVAYRYTLPVKFKL